jgi:arsenite-transporting ATPase
MVVELLDVERGGRKVVIVLGKGGVGKTTVSILLAGELSRLGRTLLASFDPAGHW